MRLLVRFLFATAVAAPAATNAANLPRARDNVSASEDDDDEDVDDEVIDRALRSLVASTPPHRAGAQFAQLLEAMPAFDATRIASIAALSPDVDVRRAIADALASRFRLVGDDVMLDHLRRDPDADVRNTASRATASRVGVMVRWPSRER